jgi:hypothetical protein
MSGINPTKAKNDKKPIKNTCRCTNICPGYCDDKCLYSLGRKNIPDFNDIIETLQSFQCALKEYGHMVLSIVDMTC